MSEVNTKLISSLSYNINIADRNNDQLGSEQDFYSFGLAFKNIFQNSLVPLERAMFIDEFHGLMFGANANPDWRKTALLVADTVECLIKLYKPTNALVCDAAPVFTRATQHINSVDTLNLLTTALLSNFIGEDNFDNVNTLSYEDLSDKDSYYDMAIILMGHCHSEELLNNFMNSIKQNGVFLITNSSYAGQLYENEKHQSRYIHDIIRASEKFSLYHFATPIAMTLCIKDR